MLHPHISTDEPIGPTEKDARTVQIPFDDAAADTLINTADQIAATLRGQAGSRTSAAETGLLEFSGGYRNSYIALCTAERVDRERLTTVLLDLSENVAKAKSRAAEERARLKALQAWEQREDARREQRKLDPTGASSALPQPPDPQPSTAPIAPPEVSAAFEAAARQRRPTIGQLGARISADPTRLRSFVASSRSLNSSLDSALGSVESAWSSFHSSCQWVNFGTTSFVGGFAQLIGENQADATFIAFIADAFEKAGSGTISMADVKYEVYDDPKLARLLGGKLSPAEVAAAWDELMKDTSGKYDPHALLLNYADKLGELDGLPALARVEANRNRAPGLLKAAEEALSRAKANGESEEATKYYEHQISYLNQVVSGDVQLYLYDESGSRIIEMIGTPGPDTVRTVTYVPGTYTGMDSFYTGGVQTISKHLTQKLTGTVAFVYKDGVFPGETEKKSTDTDLKRIVEANDENNAEKTGQQLARFEEGMRSDPALKNTEQLGIGHSWGLANLTSSEVAGAHYDRVVSLAGAGMPENWTPNSSTKYVNINYYDILIHAQSKGVVWGGRNPVSSRDFEQFQFAPDKDLGRFINSKEELDYLMDNHNRITRDSADNRVALKILTRVLKE